MLQAQEASIRGTPAAQCKHASSCAKLREDAEQCALGAEGATSWTEEAELQEGAMWPQEVVTELQAAAHIHQVLINAYDGMPSTSNAAADSSRSVYVLWAILLGEV